MRSIAQRLAIASIFLCLGGCAGGGSTSAVPSSASNGNGTLTTTNGAGGTGGGSGSNTNGNGSGNNGGGNSESGGAGAPLTANAPSGPYRVHAFLEDTTGNAGCLFSGNYAAVKNEADITEAGSSSFGRLPCPATFDVGRHAAGLKTYAYNDVAVVGNGMPFAAIDPAFYFENSSCTEVFVQPAGAPAAGRAFTNLGQYPLQIAAAVNAWEAVSSADYFLNDNVGDISTLGISAANFCPSQWSVASYTAGISTFINALSKPQIVNPMGGYGDPYTVAVAQSKAAMVASEEGITNFINGAMFSLAKTEERLNRLLEFETAGKDVALIQYNPAALDNSGRPIEFPAGFGSMVDQRLWNYAGGWLVLDYAHFYMATANEGNFTNSGATVEPEYYLVPQNPLKTLSAGTVAGLQAGPLLVREYRSCYYKSVLVGECAMVLNPSAAASSIPPLAQNYAHSVVIAGEGAMPALAGVAGGVSTPADTGTIDLVGSKLTSLAAGRAAILMQ
jgi:hypothetical protein